MNYREPHYGKKGVIGFFLDTGRRIKGRGNKYPKMSFPQKGPKTGSPSRELLSSTSEAF